MKRFITNIKQYMNYYQDNAQHGVHLFASSRNKELTIIS